MTNAEISFALMCRRVHTRFSVAVVTGDMRRVRRALINATRLWNLADHRADGEKLWHALDTYCGEWFYVTPRDTNSARFTYAETGPITSLLNICGAVNDYATR